jgi:hypothetical protein
MEVLPKRRLTFKKLHGVISQKTVLFITTAVITSNNTLIVIMQSILKHPILFYLSIRREMKWIIIRGQKNEREMVENNKTHLEKTRRNEIIAQTTPSLCFESISNSTLLKAIPSHPPA